MMWYVLALLTGLLLPTLAAAEFVPEIRAATDEDLRYAPVSTRMRLFYSPEDAVEEGEETDTGHYEALIETDSTSCW